MGCYLTDGKRLFRVKDAAEGHVALENCAAPEESPEWRKVDAVLRDLTRVRRS